MIWNDEQLIASAAPDLVVYIALVLLIVSITTIIYYSFARNKHKLFNNRMQVKVLTDNKRLQMDRVLFECINSRQQTVFIYKGTVVNGAIGAKAMIVRD